MEIYSGAISPCKTCSDRAYVFLPRPHDPEGHKLYIRAGRKSELYRVTEAYPGDDQGAGFRLRKAGSADVYTVYLHGSGERCCDCPGACYGALACKHLLAVEGLVAQGALDGPDPLDSPLFTAAAFGGV